MPRLIKLLPSNNHFAQCAEYHGAASTSCVMGPMRILLIVGALDRLMINRWSKVDLSVFCAV